MHPQPKPIDQNTVTKYWVRPDCAAIAPAGLDGPYRLRDELATAATVCDEAGSAGARWCAAGLLVSTEVGVDVAGASESHQADRLVRVLRA